MAITIQHRGSSLAYCEAMGFSKLFATYAEYCSGQHIDGVGFNPHSGYTYIALDNGVQLCSMLGRGVAFLNTAAPEEIFSTYDDALNYMENDNTDTEED